MSEGDNINMLDELLHLISSMTGDTPDETIRAAIKYRNRLRNAVLLKTYHSPYGDIDCIDHLLLNKGESMTEEKDQKSNTSFSDHVIFQVGRLCSFVTNEFPVEYLHVASERTGDRAHDYPRTVTDVVALTEQLLLELKELRKEKE